MSHTSGLPALAYAENVIGGVIGSNESWFPIATYQDLLTFMQDAGDWAVTKPGQRWFYLNEGYALMGRIIEIVSGMPYVDYVKKHFFKPLGMTRSVFSKNDVEGDPDAATPYVNWAAGDRIPSTYAYGTITADGGIVSSVLDLAKYISMYLGRGTFNGAQILPASAISEMEKPRVQTPIKDSPFGTESYGFGLGMKSNFLGNKLVSHGGSVGVATAYMGYLPEKNVGVAILTNGSGFATGQFGMYGLAMLLGEDPENLPFTRQVRILSQFEGSYETYKGTMHVRVKRNGDLLTMTETDKHSSNTTIMIPETLDEKHSIFYALESGAKKNVEFIVRDDKVEFIFERYLFRKTGKLLD
jgi:CubicO group peptidase (beta-lactamase class C family)